MLSEAAGYSVSWWRTIVCCLLEGGQVGVRALVASFTTSVSLVLAFLADALYYLVDAAIELLLQLLGGRFQRLLLAVFLVDWSLSATEADLVAAALAWAFFWRGHTAFAFFFL
jgi:hypothetical protein